MFVFTTRNFNNYNQSFCIGDQSIHPSIHPLTAMLIFGTTLLIQNAAAWLVFNEPKRAHVTPLFIFLHWLPVAARIKFKTLMLPYRKITGSTPAYFHSLITIYIPSRSLKSASERRLVVPSQRGSKSLSRTFSFTIPGWWKELPTPIRNAGSMSTFWKLISFDTWLHPKKIKYLKPLFSLYLFLLLLTCTYLNNVWDLVLRALPLSVCLFEMNRFMYSPSVSHIG